MSANNLVYQTKSPILFIFFSRVDTTLQVLAQIKKAKPTKLYLAADAPREGRANEADNCAIVREEVFNFIDWECQVKTLFRDKNVGPKETITSAIDWFFKHEDEGIILEHDCLPALSFFSYCDNLLQKYRNDNRIWLICGYNFRTDNKWGDGSYYFSNLPNGWGWATWKRTWSNYDKNLNQYNSEDVKTPLEKIFDHPLIVDRWVEIFKDTKKGQIDTWDYQLTFAHLFNHALSIIPNYNLVSNIGFGELAENTTNINSPFANVPLESIDEIIHPKFMVPEKEADTQMLFAEFDIHHKLENLKKHNSVRRRLKRWLKSLIY